VVTLAIREVEFFWRKSHLCTQVCVEHDIKIARRVKTRMNWCKGLGERV